MPDLNIDLDYFEHPKVMLLVEKVGFWAEILPIRLWRFTAKYHAETGKITGPSVQLIERHLNWRGKKGEGINALVECGFLEPAEGGYVVHDFLDHQGHIEAYRRRGKAAAEARWGGRAKSSANVVQEVCNKHPPSNALTEPTNGADGADGAENGISRDSFWLAREWLMHKAGAHTEPDRKSSGNFDDLITAGVSMDDIIAEIKRKGRKRSESIWDFCKRLDPKKAGSKDRFAGCRELLEEDVKRGPS